MFNKGGQTKMNAIKKLLGKSNKDEFIVMSCYGLDTIKISKYDNKFTQRI